MPAYEIVRGFLIVKARCCRVWLVCPYLRMGRCGFCGERPKIVQATDD